MGFLFKPPDPLVLDNNIADNWKRFSQKFDVFLTASNLKEKPEETQIAVFLNLVGDDGLELYNSFTYTDEEKKTVKGITKKFDDYCTPTANVTFERYKFNSICQKEGQTFDSFLTELRKAVKTTNYKDPDDMIRDRIVMGVCEKSTQERLLRESKLTLTKAIDFCRATEVSKSQAKVLQSEVLVNAVGRSSFLKREEQGKKCKFCGYIHSRNKCPAFNKTCAKCQGRNHFAAMCPNGVKEDRQRNNGSKDFGRKQYRKVHEVERNEEVVESDSDSDSEFYVNSVNLIGYVNSTDQKATVWSQKVNIADSELVNFKLDTGAEVSVLPLTTLRKCNLENQLKPTKVCLVSYGSSDFKIKPEGKVSFLCKANGNEAWVDFVVVNVDNQLPLLGLTACLALKLIKRLASISQGPYVTFNSLNDVTKKYKSVFDGLGEFPKEHHITLKNDAVPHIQPPRRVPRALYDRLKIKLEQLEAQGVIKKLEGPTEWLNPLVIVEKNNKDLRLCLDPKFLNKAIQREHFLIPTAEEIAVKLCDKEYFTVLDMKDGYFQIKIDQESSKYTAFGTPFGSYTFLRLPFGISSAPEVFQRKNFEIFGDLDGVGLYFDDLIVTGKDEQEHDYNLHLVLERALKHNIKFNSAKVQFKSKFVKFMGQIYSKGGVEPNKTYIKAIIDLPIPSNKSELLRVLGMAKYFGKFVPNMSKITAPLRNLTRQDVEWNWGESHEQSLSQLKHLLTSAPILQFFNSKSNIEIETDASKDGLGACLLQEGHPIAFASRSLNSTEQKYAQIEKEMLAIVFALQKFHFFVYGLKIQVMTDHKPLETIFKKDLASISPRLQRMRLRLLNYDLSVSYKPGKYLYIADTLSRAFLSEPGLKSNVEFDFAVHSVVKNVPMANERKQKFKDELTMDPYLKVVADFCSNGWPENKNNVPDFAKHYYKLRDSLIFVDGLLLFSEKLVVPYSLRSDMLKLLHEGHMGIEKSKARARQIFYWPGINADIENYIKKCKLCEANSNKQQKETLLLYPLPERPWERLGLDIFSYGGQSYLVVFDSFSNWLEIRPIKDKSIKSCIKILKNIFSVFGSPDFVTCDNVPFNCYEFKSFAKEWNIIITTRSPNYPRSNGLAEKGVGIGKKLLKKCLEGGEDIEIALLQYRNSPLKHIDYSPSQLLNSRVCKTKIPINVSLLKPKVCENIHEKLLLRHSVYKKQYNENAKDLKPLNINADVTMYNHVQKKWEPGKVLANHESPRSYWVENEVGDSVRRNRVDLRESLNKFQMLGQPTSFESTDNLLDSDQSHDQPFNLSNNIVPHLKLNKASPKPQSKALTKNIVLESPKISRSGRVIKAPDELNL